MVPNSEDRAHLYSHPSCLIALVLVLVLVQVKAQVKVKVQVLVQTSLFVTV